MFWSSKGVLKLSHRTAHVALFDTFDDSEVGRLLVDLRTGRFSGEHFDIVAVAEGREPITTMGGVRMVPDAALAELDPSESAVLVLAGGEMWDTGGGHVFVDAAKRFLEAGVRVAAICGATSARPRRRRERLPRAHAGQRWRRIEVSESPPVGLRRS
jgi:putative intracellular protease/amidase